MGLEEVDPVKPDPIARLRCASPHDVMTPTRNVLVDDAIEVNDMIQPPLSQQMELEMNDSDQVDEQDLCQCVTRFYLWHGE
jgi:hypothetical protein